MKEQKRVAFKPWEAPAFAILILIVVYNYDPVGNWLVKTLGPRADQWVLNILFVVVIFYLFVKKK